MFTLTNGSPEIASLFIQLMKALFVYLILPTLVLIIAGITLNFFANRRSMKKLISVLEKEIDSKVDIKKFDASVARIHEQREEGDSKLHQRVDKVKDFFSESISEVKANVSWIKGFLEKNGAI